MLAQSCTAPEPQQLAARVLIDDARAYIGGSDGSDAVPPPAGQAGRGVLISPPAMAPSVQQEQDTGPLANFGLSYTGGAVAQKRATSPVPSAGQGARQQQQSPAPAPALAPAQACQQGMPCPGKLQFAGAPVVVPAMAPVRSVASQGSAPQSVSGQSLTAPISTPVVAPAPPAPLRSPSKALPPGAFQKAVPAPKTELTFKSN
ncbi:g168 [Coccomyxa elongata]